MTLFKNRNNASLAFKFGPASLPKYPFHCVNCMPRADVNWEHGPLTSPCHCRSWREWSLLFPDFQDLDLCCIMNHCIWSVVLMTYPSYELFPLGLISLSTLRALCGTCLIHFCIPPDLTQCHTKTHQYIVKGVPLLWRTQFLLSASFLQCRPAITCTFQCLSVNSFSLKGSSANSLLFLDLHVILPKRYLCGLADLTHRKEQWAAFKLRGGPSVTDAQFLLGFPFLFTSNQISCW